jgi:hypothetical protein
MKKHLFTLSLAGLFLSGAAYAALDMAEWQKDKPSYIESLAVGQRDYGKALETLSKWNKFSLEETENFKDLLKNEASPLLLQQCLDNLSRELVYRFNEGFKNELDNNVFATLNLVQQVEALLVKEPALFQELAAAMGFTTQKAKNLLPQQQRLILLKGYNKIVTVLNELKAAENSEEAEQLLLRWHNQLAKLGVNTNELSILNYDGTADLPSLLAEQEQFTTQFANWLVLLENGQMAEAIGQVSNWLEKTEENQGKSSLSYLSYIVLGYETTDVEAIANGLYGSLYAHTYSYDLQSYRSLLLAQDLPAALKLLVKWENIAAQELDGEVYSGLGLAMGKEEFVSVLKAEITLLESIVAAGNEKANEPTVIEFKDFLSRALQAKTAIFSGMDLSNQDAYEALIKDLEPWLVKINDDVTLKDTLKNATGVDFEKTFNSLLDACLQRYLLSLAIKLNAEGHQSYTELPSLLKGWQHLLQQSPLVLKSLENLYPNLSDKLNTTLIELSTLSAPANDSQNQ